MDTVPDPTHTKLIESCTMLFLKYGVRNITLSDVAARLGMSKKTIYQHFANKEELIRACLEHDKQRDKCDFLEISKAGYNPVEEIVRYQLQVTEQLNDVSPAVIFELRKYYPKLWDGLDAFHREMVQDSMTNNLNRGIAEGYYRPELDVDVVVAYYQHLPQTLFELIAQFNGTRNNAHVYHQLTSLFLRGICTPQGICEFARVFADVFPDLSQPTALNC
jgi:TetR/AcrR family transcriptional regulator, cholesterol catabolism regulator